MQAKTQRVLVTGGAGFIGSHLVDALVAQGHAVRVLDAMVAQVHPTPPSYLNEGATYVRADVREAKVWPEALEGIETVYHLAAAVGVGQSMYQISDYVDTNTRGTSHLLNVLANGPHVVRKVVVASSMSLYGEGSYACRDHGEAEPSTRTDASMKGGQWEPACPQCGASLEPRPTPETKRLDCTSVYALTKKDQEEYSLMVGRTYGVPTVALRLFNTYGPRQSLSNPYTGVAAIFASRIKNGQPPLLYEDGLQTRDFVSVHDVARAFLLAGTTSGADYEAVNVGTGRATSIRDLATTLVRLYGSRLVPEASGSYRAGDIRHCSADITKARARLGFEPKVDLEAGLRELVQWGQGQHAADHFGEANSELVRRGLVPGAKTPSTPSGPTRTNVKRQNH